MTDPIDNLVRKVNRQNKIDKNVSAPSSSSMQKPPLMKITGVGCLIWQSIARILAIYLFGVLFQMRI